ncbi:MAG: hypothetical protein ACR2MY_14955 [Candidatus Dormibacteria bacterium]
MTLTIIIAKPRTARSGTGTRPARSLKGGGSAELFQEDWVGDLPAPRPAPAALLAHYLTTVSRVRVAVEARSSLRSLMLDAVRAAVAADLTQDRVRNDLRLSRPRASELFRIADLQQRLVGDGLLPHEAVSVSHLETLLPLDPCDIHRYLAEIVDRGLSVTELRRLIRARSPRAPEPAEVESVRQALGTFLRRGWEQRVHELLAAVAELSVDVPSGTRRRKEG